MSETRDIDGLVELIDKPTDPKLHNPDLDPTGVGERTWTAFNMATLWVGMAVCIPTYTLAAEEGLDAEPAAGDDRAHERRDVRAKRAERRSQQHRKRNAIRGPRMGVEHHRNQHNHVAQKNRENRLLPVHALLN
jgi:hypothetical protein